MKLFIQNMVSRRCKMMVESELVKMGLGFVYVHLGEVLLVRPISIGDRILLHRELHKSGLELMDDKMNIIIEKIKNIVIEQVHYTDELPKTNFSNIISKEIGKDYHFLSSLFSKVKGITIEHYIILHKIERVKELILYDELNINEIAYKLHYSSAAHLSNQFKRVTGLTPSFYKTLSNKRRQFIEDL